MPDWTEGGTNQRGTPRDKTEFGERPSRSVDIVLCRGFISKLSFGRAGALFALPGASVRHFCIHMFSSDVGWSMQHFWKALQPEDGGSDNLRVRPAAYAICVRQLALTEYDNSLC